MERLKHFMDIAAAAATAVGLMLPTVLGALSSIGAIVWYGIRIYEYFKAKNGNVGIN